MLDRNSGAFVGAVGFPRSALAPNTRTILLPRYWHRGLMSEASQAAFEWVCSTGCAELEAFIEPANSNSIAFAERNGFRSTEQVVDLAVRYVKPRAHVG